MLDWNTSSAILVSVIGVVGVFFGLPYFLRRLEERRRQKRQNAVRAVLARRGVATTADMARDGIKKSDAIKAVHEMRHSGEIIPSHDASEDIALWKFRPRAHFGERRAA